MRVCQSLVSSGSLPPVASACPVYALLKVGMPRLLVPFGLVRNILFWNIPPMLAPTLFSVPVMKLCSCCHFSARCVQLTQTSLVAWVEFDSGFVSHRWVMHWRLVGHLERLLLLSFPVVKAVICFGQEPSLVETRTSGCSQCSSQVAKDVGRNPGSGGTPRPRTTPSIL